MKKLFSLRVSHHVYDVHKSAATCILMRGLMILHQTYFLVRAAETSENQAWMSYNMDKTHYRKTTYNSRNRGVLIESFNQM